MNRKQLLERIKLNIQKFDPIALYKSEVEQVNEQLKKDFEANESQYENYPGDREYKLSEAAVRLQNIRTQSWHEFITLINVESGLNINYTVGAHSDDHIKQFLINTINHELLCLKEKSWTRYITFDRILLLLSTIGNIVVSMIQVCN